MKPRPLALDLLFYAPNTQEKESCVKHNPKMGHFDFYNKDNDKIIIISFDLIYTIKLQ
jgi:hypothetical protein